MLNFKKGNTLWDYNYIYKPHIKGILFIYIYISKHNFSEFFPLFMVYWVTSIDKHSFHINLFLLYAWKT